MHYHTTRRSRMTESSRRSVAHALLLLLLISSTGFASGQITAMQLPERNGVLILNQTTFLPAVKTYDPLFLLFDSPVRYGSVTLARRFADAAQALRQYNWNSDSKLRFASVDVSLIKRELPYELKVLGLPALVRFNCNPVLSFPVDTGNGIPSAPTVTCSSGSDGIQVYRGGRTSMEFQRFMLDQPLRDVIQVSTREELKALVTTRQFVALFVVDGLDSQAFFDSKVLAQIDDDTTTYVVTTEMLEEDESPIASIPALVLYREFGEERIVFDGRWNKAALSQFLQKNRYNLISTYTSTESSYFYDRAADGHVLLFSDPDESYHRTLLADVQDIAQQYYAAANNPGEHVLRFVVIPKNEEMLKHAMGVLDSHYPTVLIMRNLMATPTRLPFVGGHTLEVLHAGNLSQSLVDHLEAIYAPFMTTDLLDDEGEPSEETKDWRDYSDLFENTRQPELIAFQQSATLILSGSRQLSEMVVSSGDEDVFGPELDLFLSIFDKPNTGMEIGPALVDVSTKERLHELWREAPLLVVFHSAKCYSCRQAKQSIDQLVESSPHDLTSAGIFIVAMVNLENVDVSDWPLHFEWLPGIFLLTPPERSFAFPSRTAMTPEALAAFLHSPESFSHVADL